MVLGKVGDELCVGVGSGSAELVIEMDDGENNANFGAEVEDQTKECDRVGASGNGNAHTVSGFQQRVLADIGEDGGGKGLHRNMVHLYPSMLFTSP
jgi:hypothetical protein